MKTFKAYTLHNANATEADAPVATVWWDGHKLCSTNDAILKRLKQQTSNGLDYSAGEEFFAQIPRIYKSGYLYVKKTQVDENGKPV